MSKPQTADNDAPAETLARIICRGVHPGIAKIAKRDSDGCGYDGACGWCYEAAELVIAAGYVNTPIPPASTEATR